MPVTIPGSVPPSPTVRNCCMLNPNPPPITTGLKDPGVGVADPARLGPHKLGGGDVTGTIYTCAAGFIDLGHLRDLADLTYFYHYQLTKGGHFREKSQFRTKPYEGFVLVEKEIPEKDRGLVAASIAFDQSVFHEIYTYWLHTPGFHNSAFSPEDLSSNFFGTHVAERALATTSAFDAAVTTQIKTLLQSLGAVTPARTRDAFSKIDNKYIRGLRAFWMGWDNYLKRRNFHFDPIQPCLVPGVDGCPSSPAFPANVPKQFPTHIRGYYDVAFGVPKDAKDALDALRGQLEKQFLIRSRFAAAIAKIKADAKTKYTNDFESCAT